MKENEIRPQDLLQRYLALCTQDAKRCFSGVSRRALACVACGNETSKPEFEKDTFGYARCLSCGTLFQTPRPTLDAFEQFYRDSESSRFWAEVFFPAVAEIRREKIFRPRVHGLSDLCDARGVGVRSLVDVGAGYGIFLEEWCARFPGSDAVAIEPSEHLAEECRNKGLRVIESIAEHARGIEAWADLVVCFEVLEHVDAPLAFIEVLMGMARPGGQVFVSTLCIDGFDLQMLGRQSSQISPPHHINFMSVCGFQKLFERAGLVDIQIETPGRLDVDIVKNAAAEDPELLAHHGFLRCIMEDSAKASAFQQFLSDNQLSSHAWIIGTKPL